MTYIVSNSECKETLCVTDFLTFVIILTYFKNSFYGIRTLCIKVSQLLNTIVFLRPFTAFSSLVSSPSTLTCLRQFFLQ